MNITRTICLLLLPLALCIVLVLLLDQDGGRPTTQHFSDPLVAAQYGGLNSLRRMIKDDPDVVRKTDRRGLTPLHYTALGHRPEVAEYLISKGADVDARAKHGQTPLYNAAWYGALDVAKVLVRHGADVNAREEGVLTSDYQYDGRGVLSAATWSGDVELVKWLLKKGAKIEYGRGETKSTALHWAVYDVAYKQNPKSTIKIIDLLAKKTGNINVRDGEKRTPLHRAAQTGAAEVVRHLLENYPDIKINAQDEGGNTPLDYARDPGAFHVEPEEQAATIQILLKHGAKASVPNGEEDRTTDDLRKPVEADKP